MKIHSISFKTWCAAHPDDHSAKWCRELYPWQAFAKIDYGAAARRIPQTLSLGHERFIATVTDEFLGGNGRPNFLIHLETTPESKTQQWENSQWNHMFQLVASIDGHFITLFTKKEDPSKDLLRRFLAGGLESVEAVRSLPLSGLLFRSLVDYAAHDLFGEMEDYAAFEIHDSSSAVAERRPSSVRRISRFEPFRSVGRDLWVVCTFTEEKAHRLALSLVGACRSLLAVYCQPTLARHHRCTDPSVKVLSLIEFLGLGPSAIRTRYLPQARFLLNHLQRRDDAELLQPETELKARILSGKEEPRRIVTSELREAKSVLGRVVGTTGDTAYALASANLLNAALNRNLRLYDGSVQLEKDVYSFKSQLCKTVEQLTQSPISGVELYVAPDGLVYVRVRGVQFSFHAIPNTPVLRAFAATRSNLPQDWSGVRLQPIAPLVLAWARALLIAEGPVRT